MSLVWSEARFATGFEQIDAQHREMFAHANELLDAVRRGSAPDEVRSLLADLGEQAADHFCCEEALMERRNCSACTANKLAHKWFLIDFRELGDLLAREGVTDRLADEIEDKVCHWLESHLLAIDLSLRAVQEDPG